MKIYLVGGAVRDTLLNYPVKERDWVVVGASPEEMLNQKFKPVGKDFPVFLHPETGEEYALARTERKSGHGYGGFIFHTASDVSLEDDLARRDLTINAIAQNDDGQLIDPYNGQRDIQSRYLRHVSPAFVEDPLRVLRVARFAARYHHLNFRIADETLALMKDISQSGELEYLAHERVWQEIKRSICGNAPHIFFEVLRKCGALQVLLPEIDALFGVPQPEKHHPEIDTGVHCMMALTQSVKLKCAPEGRFATLTHDLGKAETPSEILPSHHGHEKRGLPIIRQLCARLGVANNWRDLALLVAEFHTHCHRALELRASTLLETLENLDALRRPERFEQFLLCCTADVRGRTGKENEAYKQTDFLRAAHRRIADVKPTALIDKGLSGGELGKALRAERLSALNTLKKEWQDESP